MDLVFQRRRFWSTVKILPPLLLGLAQGHGGWSLPEDAAAAARVWWQSKAYWCFLCLVLCGFWRRLPGEVALLHGSAACCCSPAASRISRSSTCRGAASGCAYASACFLLRSSSAERSILRLSEEGVQISSPELVHERLGLLDLCCYGSRLIRWDQGRCR